MRSLYETAALLGVASILLTGRYGYQMADAEVDRWIAAVMFGSISLCAFLFDAGAVNLWFRGARKVAVCIAGIAFLALVVTVGNSLRAIVSRADTVEAKRQDVIMNREDARRDLQRLERAIEGLGRFTPTDDTAVNAAKRAADAATKSREAECEKRGAAAGLCRDREKDERAANKALADAAGAKATTDTARRYEAQIAAIKQRQEAQTGAPVGNANPLAAALSSVVGAAGEALTAWHKFIIAVTYELCLVGLMVLYTTLGEVSRKGAPDDLKLTQDAVPALPLASPPAPRLAASNPETPVGSVKRILTDSLERAKGAHVELAELAGRYRAVCREQGKRACTLDAFTTDVEAFCQAVGIKRRKEGEHIYLVDVRLTAQTGQATG